MKLISYKNWIKILLLIMFIFTMVYISLKFAPQISNLVKDPEKLRTILLSYGAYSTVIFVILQSLQVLVVIIPGQLVEVAGGYIYGTVVGSLYSVLGISLGTIIAFYLARFLGYPLLKLVVSQKNIDKFSFLINSPRAGLMILILFLLPGIPKDYLAYMAGLIPIKPLSFFTISMGARIPGIIFASFLGSNLQNNNYIEVTILLILVMVIFAIFIIYKERILSHLQKSCETGHRAQ